MVSRLKTNEKVVGLKQVRKAISSGEALTVYIARDVDDHIKENVLKDCLEKEIEVVYIDTMNELGNACGIDVNAAIAALL